MTCHDMSRYLLFLQPVFSSMFSRDTLSSTLSRLLASSPSSAFFASLGRLGKQAVAHGSVLILGGSLMEPLKYYDIWHIIIKIETSFYKKNIFSAPLTSPVCV